MPTQYLMIVDGLCPACSSLGREVAGISQIRAVAEQSAEAEGLRQQVAFEAPCLVLVDTVRKPRVFTGWKMRFKLMQILGWRQSRDWFRLFYKELEARQAREGTTRRTLLTGAGLGVLAAALNVVPAAADEGTSAAASSITNVGLDASKAALASPEGKQAVANWGPAVDSYKVVSNGHPATALVHGSGQVSFLVEEMPKGSFSLALSGKNLEISSVEGGLLGSLDVSGKDASPVYPDSGVGPQNTYTFGVCFVACMGGSISSQCIVNCVQAAINPTDTLACFLCAGQHGISCMWACRHHIL